MSGDQILMPRSLTAENGAKSALIGEFSVPSFQPCPSCQGCDSDDCPRCDGEGVIPASIKRGQAEAELARLRAQEPVAWMWNDMIGIPHTHISPTRPTWPDAGASSAMSVAIDVRPLYAEPMPAPSLKDNEIAQLVNALRDCAVEFHAAQQLRERIAAIVVPVLRGVRSPMSAKVSQ